MAKHKAKSQKAKSQKNSLPAALTIASPLATLRPDRPLTPAMAAIIWRIGNLLDERRIPSDTGDDLRLEVSARELRGPGAQARNRWLRECLDRLTGVKLSGEFRGRAWGAVLVAEWELDPRLGGSVSLLIPRNAVRALRGPETFARVEEAALWRMSGPARRLYVALADRKRQDRCWHEYSLDELRDVFGVPGKYRRWDSLRERRLLPALTEIEAFGTVSLTLTPLKTGRRITGVRIAWRWKDLDEIRVTAEETEKARPYAEQPAVSAAPPLIPETREAREQNERAWWGQQPSVLRERLEEEADKQNAAEEAADTAWAEKAAEGAAEPLRTTLVESGKASRRAGREAALIRQAYEKAHPDDPPFNDLEPAP